MLKQPFFIVIIYPLNFYRFAHIKHGNSAYYHAKLHTNTKTPNSFRKSLDFKPFLNTFAKSYKNPMALFLNSRLCRCYTLMTFTPLYPIYPTQFDIRQTGFDKIPLLLCEIRHKMISAEFFIFIDIFPAKTYNNIRDGKPSSGEFLPDSGKLYIQESSCQIVENFINQEIPCQTVGNFKIKG